MVELKHPMIPGYVITVPRKAVKSWKDAGWLPLDDTDRETSDAGQTPTE